MCTNFVFEHLNVSTFSSSCCSFPNSSYFFLWCLFYFQSSVHSTVNRELFYFLSDEGQDFSALCSSPPQVDMFSYGMVLYELLTGKRPSLGHHQLQIAKKLSKGIRPLLGNPEEVQFCCLQTLLTECWDTKPEKVGTLALFLFFVFFYHVQLSSTSQRDGSGPSSIFLITAKPFPQSSFLLSLVSASILGLLVNSNSHPGQKLNDSQ